MERICSRRGVLVLSRFKAKKNVGIGPGIAGRCANGIAAVGEVGCNHPITPPKNLDRFAFQGVEVSVADKYSNSRIWKLYVLVVTRCVSWFAPSVWVRRSTLFLRGFLSPRHVWNDSFIFQTTLVGCLPFHKALRSKRQDFGLLSTVPIFVDSALVGAAYHAAGPPPPAIPYLVPDV